MTLEKALVKRKLYNAFVSFYMFYADSDIINLYTIPIPFLYLSSLRNYIHAVYFVNYWASCDNRYMRSTLASSFLDIIIGPYVERPYFSQHNPKF